MLTSKDILRLLSLLFFFFLHQPQFKGLSFGGWQKVEPCLNYQRDSIELYNYHLRSIYERVAVHIHALNKKIADDPRVTVNILPISSGLTIATKL